MDTSSTCGPQLLVIDDEPMLRDILCEVLIEEGYRVITSPTYFTDLDVLVQMNPDLIILDIVLGGRQAGMEFLGTLKADPRTVRIPVAVCTGASHLTEQINARLSKWDCLLISKPFDLDEMLAELNRCLHQHDLEPAA